VVGAYVFVFITLLLLKKHYEDYVELRHQYLQQPRPQNYTVLVDEIPKDMRSHNAVGGNWA
jgi:hypothetical protein